MQDFSKDCVLEKKSYFSTETHVVSTQKNRLNEIVLLSTQNMLKLRGKQILTILQDFS